MKLYKSPCCANLAEKIVDSGRELMCCGEPMQELRANTTDAAQEKHVPDVKIDGNKLHVQIGSVEHPMAEEHHIVFIAAEFGNMSVRKNLKPGEKPVAAFDLGGYHGPVTVYEYCNLHGLWKKELTV